MPAKKQASPESVSFNGPAGETTIPLYTGMVDDLPPMSQVRLEDTILQLRRGEIGDGEFMMKLGAIFTHLPTVPGNQRLDARMLDRLNLNVDTVRDLVAAGGAIMPFIGGGEGDDSGNAPN